MLQQVFHDNLKDLKRKYHNTDAGVNFFQGFFEKNAPMMSVFKVIVFAIRPSPKYDTETIQKS